MKKTMRRILALCLSITLSVTLLSGLKLPHRAYAAAPEGSIAIDATIFPDDNFRAFVSENYDLAGEGEEKDGYLSPEEIAVVTVMDCSCKNIADLTGISYFTELKELACSGNQLTALDISLNTELTCLNCSLNQLTALNVDNLTSLRVLACANNSISAIDVSNNLLLEELVLGGSNWVGFDTLLGQSTGEWGKKGNDITTLDVSANTELTHLAVSFNQLSSLDISHNTKLKIFYCDDNQIEGPLDLSICPNLEVVNVSSNKISSLNLTGCNKIKRLFVEDNLYTTLTIPDEPDLEELYCGGIIEEINFGSAPKLRYMWCHNVAESLDFSNLDIMMDVYKNGTCYYSFWDQDIRYRDYALIGGIQELILGPYTAIWTDESTAICEITFDTNGGSAVPSQNVAFAGLIEKPANPTKEGVSFGGWYIDEECTQLYDFNIRVSKSITLYADWVNSSEDMFPDEAFRTYLLANIDTDGDGVISSAECKNVTYLQVSGLGISSLQGIEYFKNLSTLNCYGNNLSTLDISKNLGLQELDCGNNLLSELDISQNLSLQRLDCAFNQLESIDLSSNTALWHLNLSCNQLNYLDVSQNVALLELYVTQNELDGLNVENNTLLQRLGCAYCGLTTLDVSKNEQLNTLDCSGNSLAYIDISKNAELSYLSCFCESLPSLDIRHNAYLDHALLNGEQSLGGSNYTGTVNEIIYHYLEWENEYLIENYYLSVPDTCVVFSSTAPENVSVTFELMDGTPVDTVEIPFGTPVERPANPVKEGWIFDGWYVDGALTVRHDFSRPIGKDTTLFGGWVQAAEDMFPDPVFRAYVLEHFDENDDGMLSHIECNLVTHIDLFNEEDWSAGLGITSLQGIEYFVNLEWLQTISNPLTSIDVSQNHNLDLLSVSNAQLESLDVSNNTELTYLQFNNNNISSIDLSSNSKLIHLGCGGNPLVSLDLSHNTELKEIDALCYDLPMLDLSSNPYMERTYEEGTLSYMDEDMVYIPVYSLNEDSLSTSLCTSYRTVIKTSNSPESCNVTFYVNNGTDAQTTAVPFATAVSEPAVPENGAMEFTGWYEDEGLTRLYDFTRLVGKDINLYAGWQEVFTPVVIADAFPDPFFRAYVSEHFDLADEQGVKDGQLSKEEAEAVFDIDLNNYDNMLQGYGITTLQGIEYFPNLVSLQVNSNPITELNVSMNPHLVSLYCGNCQLNSLDLHNNAELIALECSNNNLSALDLSNNPMLYSLYCSGNQLTELDLSHNNSLMWLETCFNEIPILDISSNEYLTKAFTEGTLCYISGDEDYHNAPRYQYDFVTDEGYVQNWLIGISYTTVVKTNYSPESCSVTFYPENGSEASTETVSFATAVSEPTVPVNGEMEFTGWWYDDNGLTKLFDFTRLVGTDINLYAGWREYLAPVTIAEAFPDDTFRDYVCNNFDSDGDGILSSDERAAVKNIVLYDFVYSEGMGITSLQGIEYFPNLEYLNCSSNNLTSLDIGQNLKLVALECGYNQLTELDVSQNLLLQRLLCDGNQLTSIDVRANTDLEALYLSGNQLTSLDVSRNTLLKELYVGQNNLETLNLENNTLLLYLGCESCELVTLDVSNNKQLCNLNCGGNRLTYLDLSENTELVSLSCFNVNMAYLDIRENTYLKRALSSGEQSYGGSNLEGNILELVYHYLEIDDEYYLIANDYLSFPDTCIIYTENVPETCTVTFDSQGGSAVETVTVPFATAINRPADPTYEGEDFIGWFMDDKLTVPYNFDNPVGCDITLYAGWRIPLKPIEEMFPDSTFRSYLLEEYDGNQDGTLDYDELGSVTNLYVTAMGIESLKGIEYLSNLGELYCSFNLFTELDVSKNSFLWGLFCDHNEITELDVSKNLQLVMLSCEGCLLTDLDVSANLNLYQLNCNENQLTSLNLGNNTTIVYLNCAQNQLNSLNISNNPALVAVACAYNNLGYLDISGNLNLITAYEQGQKWEDSGYVSYEFAFTDVNQQEYNYFLSLSSDTTVITIRPDSCTITFDFGNGTTDDEVIPFGTTVSVPPVPTKEGWIFDGYWYYDAELTKPYDFMRLVGADTTLYAGWVEETIADAFPDPIFRNYVLQNIDSNQDGILSNGERKAVYELEVQALGISSLQGVECFENLTSLYCVQNNLTELNISGNPCLQFLSCGDNQISVLDISGNPLLLTAVKKGEFTDWGDGYLNYAYENLDEFGIYMEQYYLYFSQDTLVKTDEDPDTCTMTFETNGGSTVDAITVAFGATVAKPDSDPSKGEMVFDGWYTDSALTIPYDFSTRLTANVLLYAGWREYVEPTCTMTFNTNGGSAIAAKTVPFGTAVAKPNPDPSKSKMVFDGWFEDSALTIPYDFTTGLTKSITVYARWTEATTPAKDLFPDANFRAFLLENYDISKDGAFSQTELDAIDNLYISGKEIKSLQGIENLKNLKVLFCNDNQLTSIDVSKNLSLTNLDCSKNCLTTLNISNNQSLIGLECGDNQLTSLVVRPLIHLEWLGCENNQLSTLDLSQNTELSGLYCYGNRLTELDIRRNPKLSQLDCSNNQLSLLDVSACPKLWLLICHRNKLTTLDVSNLRSMDYLLECETYRNGPRVVYEYIDDDPAQPYPVYSYEGNGDGIRTDCGVTLVTAPFKTYIVTFKTNGGSEIAPVTVDYNKPVSKPADPTNGSHVFEGWFTSASCTTAYDFSKPVTGDITIYAKWRIESGQEAAKINSAALAFDGKLRLKFSYTIPDSVLKDKDAYVLFEKDGKEIARQLVSDGQIENGRHVFILDIAAQEYSDKVVVSLHDGKGNKITVTTASGEDKTDGMVYSAQTYAENKQETGSTPEMRNLAKALEDYGSATQIYFDHGDQTGLAVSGDVKSISLDELDPYAPVITGEKPEGLDKASISVAFDADNSMRIRYSFQKGVDPKKYTYTIDGVKTEIGEENGNYYLYVRNIAAPDLGKAHTFTISDGSKTYSITCSALTYARTSVQNGNEQRQDLGKALYLYNLAAKLYFDEE